MEEVVAFTEDLLRACRGLGRVRVVMRNPVGVVEIFGDLAALELRDGWAHLCAEPFHLHLHCHAIAQVNFHDGGADDTGDGRAIWFGGRGGAPLLLLVLDQERGAAAAEQARVFADLVSTHGVSRPLMSLDELPAPIAMS